MLCLESKCSVKKVKGVKVKVDMPKGLERFFCSSNFKNTKTFIYTFSVSTTETIPHSNSKTSASNSL